MEKNVFENYLKLCSSILMILNQRCFFITNQFHALVASKPAKIAGIDNPTSGRKAMAGNWTPAINCKILQAFPISVRRLQTFLDVDLAVFLRVRTSPKETTTVKRLCSIS